MAMAAAFVSGCSSRRVYNTHANAATSLPHAVNINTAAAGELERVPHIGPRTAEAIVRFREENGRFRRPEHLMQVHGISEKKFLEMREFVRIE